MKILAISKPLLIIFYLLGLLVANLDGDDAVLLARMVVYKVILEREMRCIETRKGVILQGEILSSIIVLNILPLRGKRALIL